MCGGCRVNVGGQARFACVDGPCFDAHEVDFDTAMRRHKGVCGEERNAVDPHGETGGADAVKREKDGDADARRARRARVYEVNRATAVPRAFEAERCLRCQDPVCVGGCPVNVPIPDFIHAVAMGDMAGAAILRRATRCRRSAGASAPRRLSARRLRWLSLRSGGDRPSRALRRRLGTNAVDQVRSSPGREDRSYRRRSVRLGLRGRTHPARL